MDLFCSRLGLFLCGFKEFLKPSFSSHWGNWLLAPLIAFFVGYLPSSSFAADFLYYKQGEQWPYNLHSSPEAAAAPYVPKGYTAFDHTMSYGGITRCETENGGKQYLCYYTSTYTRTSPPEPPKTSDDLYIVVFRYSCSESSKLDPDSPCYEKECPSEGTPYTGPRVSSPIGSGFTDADGCDVVPVYDWLSPSECDDGTGQSCLHVSGYQYGNTPPPTPPQPCYDASGALIGTVGAGASCPSDTNTGGDTGDGTGAGDGETGDTGTGDTGSGDTGTGDGDTGDTGTGDGDSGDTGSGTGTGTGSGSDTGTDNGGDSGGSSGTSDGGASTGGNTGGSDGSDTGGGDGESGEGGDQNTDGDGTGSGNEGDGTGGGGDCDPNTQACGWGLEDTDGGIANYWERVQNAPILQEAAKIGSGFSGGGSCSPISVDAGMFGSATLDMHCSIFSQVAGLLSSLMIGIWSILAVRIVLSA